VNSLVYRSAVLPSTTVTVVLRVPYKSTIYSTDTDTQLLTSYAVHAAMWDNMSMVKHLLTSRQVWFILLADVCGVRT